MKKLFFVLCLCSMAFSSQKNITTVCNCYYFTSTVCGLLVPDAMHFLGEILAIERRSDATYYSLRVIDSKTTESIGDTLEIKGESGYNCTSSIGAEVGQKYFINLNRKYFTPSPYTFQEYQLPGCGQHTLLFERDSLFGLIEPGIHKMSYADFMANYENCLNAPKRIYANIGLKNWKDNVRVDSVEISVNGFKQKVNLGQNSYFVFPYAELVNDFEVAPISLSSSSNPTQGISTTDLIRVQKHILGQDPITNPYQMLAADVTLSGDITTFDIIQMRKLLLHRIDKLEHGHSWVFIAPEHQFEQMPSWDEGVINQASEIHPALIYPSSSITFTAVKLGDVNGSI